MNKSEVRRYNIDVTDRLDLIPLGGEIDIFNEIEILSGEDPDDGGFDAEVGDKLVIFLLRHITIDKPKDSGSVN